MVHVINHTEELSKMSVAQRALELAWKADCGALKSDPYGRDDFDEIAAILRHYAEIMQSEPVATSTAGVTEMTDYIWNIKFSRVKTENGRVYCDSGDAEIYAKSEEEVKEIFYEEMSSGWVLDEIVKGERLDFEED